MLMISADKFLNLTNIAFGNNILYADRVGATSLRLCTFDPYLPVSPYDRSYPCQEMDVLP